MYATKKMDINTEMENLMLLYNQLFTISYFDKLTIMWKEFYFITGRFNLTSREKDK